jgi:hypothetical protein
MGYRKCSTEKKYIAMNSHMKKCKITEIKTIATAEGTRKTISK